MNQSTNIPTLAVLDEQFHLHTVIAESARSKVFRATHTSGHEVAVKIVYQQDGFFDELARLYAVDESPYFCECLYNYPPELSSKVAIPVDVPLPFLIPEDIDARHVGIIITEWIDGILLHQFLEEADEMEKVDGLLELTLALRDLQNGGICHGNLTLNNVMLEHDTHEVKILGLDRDPEWWDEADPTACDRGIAEDLAAIAQHFLGAPARPGRHYSKFRRQCMHPDPEKRPPLDQLHWQIKNLRQRQSPRQNLEILFGFFKPLHLLCWIIFISFSSIALNRLMGDGKVPIQQRRANILADKDLDHTQRIQLLRKLYGESDQPEFRDHIARDISEITAATQSVSVLSEDDAATPIAVVALKDKPAVITRNSLVRIGDWVEVNTRFGYVAQIDFNRIKIVFEDAYSWHFFDRPRIFRGLSYGTEVVIIWENENNLERFLSAIAQHFELDFINDSEPLYADELANKNVDAIAAPDLPIIHGKVSGIFHAQGGLDTVVRALNEAISIEISDNQLIYHNNRFQVPVYYKLAAVRYNNRPIEDIAAFLEEILGIPVEVAPSIKDAKFTITRYNPTWQELLASLHLQHSVKSKKGSLFLVLDKDPNFADIESLGGSR